MIILDVDQRSPEWHAARLGIPTASGFGMIVTQKGEPSKQAWKYMCKLAGERVSGISEESYTNRIMERGIEVEAEAIEFYELIRGVEVKMVGLCYFDKKKRFSCSPDGLVDPDGLIEVKCPIMSTHVSYLLAGGLPSDYFQQVQGQLYVTGRKWCDLITYYPAIKPLVIRIERNEEFIKSLGNELKVFCDNLDEATEKIKQ